jgi:hypothetical protein
MWGAVLSGGDTFVYNLTNSCCIWNGFIITKLAYCNIVQ